MGAIGYKRVTVVVVTHDPEIASRARRIVRLKDGEIIGDEHKIDI
jgi:ABC-type lipoprotein export system ATPase subunit